MEIRTCSRKFEGKRKYKNNLTKTKAIYLHSFLLNLWQCACFVDTKWKWWFGSLENNIILVFERFRLFFAVFKDIILYAIRLGRAAQILNINSSRSINQLIYHFCDDLPVSTHTNLNKFPFLYKIIKVPQNHEWQYILFTSNWMHIKFIGPLNCWGGGGNY